jgi:hypothetical protein
MANETMASERRIVVWVNTDTRQVRVRGAEYGRPDGGPWYDPISAAYPQWRKMTSDQRALRILETVIDLAMQGFDLGNVLLAFDEIPEFRVFDASDPMRRALWSALNDKYHLEPVEPVSGFAAAIAEMVRQYEARISNHDD